MAKRGSVEAARPHTFEAKHSIVRDYLGAWYSILLRAGFPKKLTILDSFAGPGVYPGNGRPGSPVIIIEELLKGLGGKPPVIPIELIFIENDPQDFALLERTLDDWEPKVPAGVRVTARQGRCQDLALRLLIERDALGPKRPILAFFDAEGFDIPYSLVKRIARNESSEVLITFLSARFVQLASRPSAKADSVFGDGNWRAVMNEPASAKNDFIVREYEERLRAAPFKHIKTFGIAEETGYKFHIYFGTNHIKGHKAMKRPQWKVDPVGGGRYRDPKNPNQLGLGLTLTADLAPLKLLLRDGILSDLEWHMVDAVRRSMWVTSFDDNHVNDALDQMLKAGHIERQDGKTTRPTKDVMVRLMPSLF